jgi:hypothetical protein
MFGVPGGVGVLVPELQSVLALEKSTSCADARPLMSFAPLRLLTSMLILFRSKLADVRVSVFSEGLTVKLLEVILLLAAGFSVSAAPAWRDILLGLRQSFFFAWISVLLVVLLSALLSSLFLVEGALAETAAFSSCISRRQASRM